MHARARWIEGHQALVAALLLGVPLGIGWLLRRAGVSSGRAELAQLALGVLALGVVVVIVLRGRRTDDDTG